MDFSLTENQILTGSFLYRYSTNNNEVPIRYYDHTFYSNEPRGRFLVPTLSYTERIENENETSPTPEYTADYLKRFKQEGREFKASLQFSSNEESEKAEYTQGFYNSSLYEGNTLLHRSDNT